MTEFVPTTAIAFAVLGPVLLFAAAGLAAHLGLSKVPARTRRRR